MPLPKSLVIAGIRGHVVALDKTTGSEIWKTRLKGAGFVTVVTDGDRVYAATAGEVFCLDSSGGSVLWTNRMRGLGVGLVSLLAGTASGDPGVLLEAQRRAEARRNAAVAAG
ncbi:MAG: PQQ-binding-like beta-propeller repeat protein [Gemmatimonadota bacterium]